MVEVEEGNSSDVEILYHTLSKAESSGRKQSSGPIIGKEKKHSRSFAHVKSYFVEMGFSPTLVDKVIEENGEGDADLILEALSTYTAIQKSSPEATDSLEVLSTSDVEEVNSTLKFTTHVNQAIEDREEPTEVGTDKKSSLLAMNFSLDEVDLAINRLGEGAPVVELIDFIFAARAAGSFGEKELHGSSNCKDVKNEEANAENLFGTTEQRTCLSEMGFTEDEISSAIDNFGHEVPIWELADSIFANRIACAAAKEEREENQNGSGCLGHAKEQSEGCYPVTDKSYTSAPSSNSTIYASKELMRRKRPRHAPVDGKTASQGNHRQEERLAEWETAHHAKPSPYNGLNFAKPRSLKVETPDQIIPDFGKNVHRLLSAPPYFLYGNVVDVSQEIWTKLSQFLYGIEPEFVNSQFFSALIRKEGYFHNLTVGNRVHILPKSPMTIEDALPHTRKWWPSWDTRKQLSCISSESTGIARLCGRLGKIMMDLQGMLSKDQQMDILHQCKMMNLIWVGQHKLGSIEPDQLECILGYPVKHTEIWGMEPDDRLRALKYCFQTDTIGYQLSVLKSMYPEGLKVLSIYSGIGGAEVALHRLGVHLKCVVSVEASETNKEILRRWWQTSGQVGELMQIGGIEKLTIKKLESFIKQYGGFDIVIGANPCAQFSGTHTRDGSVGVDLTLFFEFVRVFQRVRSIMGRN